MALCGKNDALTAVTDKIADIEKEITAKLDSAASDIAGSLDTKLTELENELNNLADEIPEEPVLSFQEAMDEYVNLTLDATKSSAAAEKLLELKSKFTDTLDSQGFDIDQLVSDATSALGEGASPAKSTVEKTVEDENTDTLIIQEEYETIKQVQGMKDGTNFFSGVGYTTEIDGDDTIVTTTKVFKKIKVIYTVEQTTDPSIDPITGLSLPSLDDLGLPSLSLPSIDGLDLSGVPSLSPESLAAGQAKMKDAICNMPNLEVSTGGSGVQTLDQKASGTDNIILEKTPTKIISVQGRTANNNFFSGIQYTQDGKSIFLRDTYAEVKVSYEAAVVKQKAKESLIPQEGGEVELASVFTEAQNQLKLAEEKVANITVDKELLKKNAEELKEFASNTPSIVPDAEITKDFIEECKVKEEDIKMSLVANGKIVEPAEKKKDLEDEKVDAVEVAEEESGVKLNEVSPMVNGELRQEKKKIRQHHFKLLKISSKMKRVQSAIKHRIKLPVIFEFKSKAGVKFKVKVDTAIKGQLSDKLRGNFKPSGDFTKESRRALGNWLEEGYNIRKKSRKATWAEYHRIDTRLAKNSNALEEVKAWRKKYIDELDSPVSIDDYQDYLGNYEALLTTIEEDGVAKEDFFSFDFLDDA